LEALLAEDEVLCNLFDLLIFYLGKAQTGQQ